MKFLIYFYLKEFIYIFKIIIFFNHILESTSLHRIGIWDSQKEFFHFVAKFGFQKTNQHEIEKSEGYIFGNITNLLNNTSINNNNYGTLALLPYQYFVPFYKNRSKFLFENADKTCEIMFKVRF